MYWVIKMRTDNQGMMASRLFEGIAEDDAAAMLGCIGSYRKEYGKNAFISLAGDAVTCVGLVLSGRVHMIKEDLWGEKTIIAVIEPGELFGETFACGTIDTSTVSFSAVEKSEALMLPFERVMHTCSNTCPFHQRLVENMLKMIADKNRQLMEKVEIISKLTLREKIVTYLSLCAQQAGSRSFEISLSRTEMAEFLCANRSALARELGKMKAEGLIDYSKNTFSILR